MPSEIKKTAALTWSAIILLAFSSFPGISFKIGENKSVSKTVLTFCETLASLSSPMPVSTPKVSSLAKLLSLWQ